MPARASIRYLAQFALIALCALALRWNALGDPNYQIDETFYLLVGDAMHHGALPYVDIWDRKPPGLFAIYWLAAAAPDPVLGYQLLALLSATLTAWLVRAIAAGLAGPRAGLLAALAYLAMLQPLLGGGGQSPVFYNLPIAAAAALAMRKPVPGHGDMAMIALLGGLAIAIKPTALFEAAYICLWSLWCFRLNGRPALALARRAAAMLLLGAMPMLAAFSWYAAQGHFAEIWQATVQSIFARKSEPAGNQLAILGFTLSALLPLLALAIVGTILAGDSRHARFARGWGVASVIGFLAVPGFYMHYALPLCAPLAVMAAPIFARQLVGPMAAAALVCIAAIQGGSLDLSRRAASQEGIQIAASAISRNLHGGLLYVYSGPPLLYLLSGSPRPTRYLFPEHLSIRDEAAALGVDPAIEVAAILARQPRIIVIRSRPFRAPNSATCSLVREALSRDYDLIRRVRLVEYAGPYDIDIYLRSGRRPTQGDAETLKLCDTL